MSSKAMLFTELEFVTTDGDSLEVPEVHAVRAHRHQIHRFDFDVGDQIVCKRFGAADRDASTPAAVASE